MTKNPLFWLQRIWCCIPLRLVFTLQDRTSGDLDLVWLEVLWKGYMGYRAGGPQVLSVKVSHRSSGDLDLVVGVYSGVPLRAR